MCIKIYSVFRYRVEEEEDDPIIKRVKKEPVTPSKSNMDATGNKTRNTDKRGNVQTKTSVNIETVWDSDDDIDYNKIDTEVIEPPKRSTRQTRKTSPAPDHSEPSTSKTRQSRSRSRSPYSIKTTVKAEPVSSPSPKKSKTVPDKNSKEFNDTSCKRTGRGKAKILEDEFAEIPEQVGFFCSSFSI